MKKRMIGKVIVLGIIILFVGASVTSSSNIYINNNQQILGNRQADSNSILPYRSLVHRPIMNKMTKILNPVLISNIKMGQCVKQTEDNGYIITGNIGEIDLNDPEADTLLNSLLVRYDQDGNEEWSKTFELLDGNTGYCVQQTTDQGYIIGGSVTSLDTSYAMLLKVDEQGTQEWMKTFEGLGIAQGLSAQQTSDSGYILSGSSISINNTKISYGLLIKTDENGNEEWTRTFRYRNNSIGSSVQQTEDLGYIIGGYTFDTNWSNPWTPMENEVLLIKTDENGNEEWNKTFEFMKVSIGYSVQQTDDKGYILCGTVLSSDDYKPSALLLKTYENGDEEWHKIFSNKDGHSVQQTNDKGYILGGTAISGYNSYALLIKTDEQGNEEWTKTYAGSGVATGSKAQQTNDNGYILTGTTSNSPFSLNIFMLLLKTDENGNIEWIKSQTANSIRAKAKDVFDAEGECGTLEVTMPVNQHSHSFPFLQRLLERFPNMFPILRALLNPNN
jgi:hypothetical protein